MPTRVYAKLDDDRIEQLDAECKKKDVYRPEIVTKAVELYLDTKGDSKSTIDHLKQERDFSKQEHDNIKDKYEKAVQTNKVLLARIRYLQSQGFFSRASGVKRINTDTYSISGGSK